MPLSLASSRTRTRSAMPNVLLPLSQRQRLLRGLTPKVYQAAAMRMGQVSRVSAGRGTLGGHLDP
jgi:hypothetical protein